MDFFSAVESVCFDIYLNADKVFGAKVENFIEHGSREWVSENEKVLFIKFHDIDHDSYRNAFLCFDVHQFFFCLEILLTKISSIKYSRRILYPDISISRRWVIFGR